MNSALLVLFAYICGSIPTGYWVVKAMKGIDLTKVGSGSTGTTNVLRNAGKGAALFVFIVDIAKGFVPVRLSIWLGNHGYLPEFHGNGEIAQWLPMVLSLVCLIGHSKSIFLRFKGGKSAATGLGTMGAMNPLAACGAFAVFVSVLLIGRIVSISSITAVIASGFIMWFLQQYSAHMLGHGPVAYTAFCVCGAVYVTARHKDNIKRIIAGTEPRIGQKLEDAAKRPQTDEANTST